MYFFVKATVGKTGAAAGGGGGWGVGWPWGMRTDFLSTASMLFKNTGGEDYKGFVKFFSPGTSQNNGLLWKGQYYLYVERSKTKSK